MLDITGDQGGSIYETGGGNETIVQFQMMALDRPTIIPRQGRNFSVHVNYRQVSSSFTVFSSSSSLMPA